MNNLRLDLLVFFVGLNGAIAFTAFLRRLAYLFSLIHFPYITEHKGAIQARVTTA